MKRASKIFGSLIIGLLSTSWATASVITFDNVYAGTAWSAVHDGYEGFNWDQFGVVHKDYLPGSGYANGAVSGEYVAYNQGANVATASGTSFDFSGAFLTSAWENTLDIQVDGYSGAAILYTQTVNAVKSGPTWFQFDYLGIDTLKFVSISGDVGNNQFVMDNFTFGEPAAVPVPGAFMLGALGVGCVNWARKRRSL